MELAACGLAALLAHCILLQATVHIFKITELQIQFWMPTSGWKVRRPAPTLGLLLPDAQGSETALQMRLPRYSAFLPRALRSLTLSAWLPGPARLQTLS